MQNFSEKYQRFKTPLLLVISGPSGAGKDSIIKHMRQRQNPFHFVVTATTRPPRVNEENGVDYFFISHQEFKRMIDQQELLEYAQVYNDYKGVPKQQVRQALESGKDVVMRLDVQGAATIHRLCPEAVLVFITTSDEQEMVDRLTARNTESAEELALRVEAAHQEEQCMAEFDYVVINWDNGLDQAVDAILAIITAEHHRVVPRKVTL
jgi:guanylate kinase